MSKESSVFGLGVIVLLSSFLGLPREYKEWLLIICGAFLMIIGYRLRRHAFFQSLEHENGERRGDAFVESHIASEKNSPLHKDSNEVV